MSDIDKLPLEFAQAVYYETARRAEQQQDTDARFILLHSAISGMTTWLLRQGCKRATFEVIKDAEEWEGKEGPLGKEFTTIETRVRLLEVA